MCMITSICVRACRFVCLFWLVMNNCDDAQAFICVLGFACDGSTSDFCFGCGFWFGFCCKGFFMSFVRGTPSYTFALSDIYGPPHMRDTKFAGHDHCGTPHQQATTIAGHQGRAAGSKPVRESFRRGGGGVAGPPFICGGAAAPFMSLCSPGEFRGPQALPELPMQRLR